MPSFPFDSKDLKVSKPETGVLLIELNRPKVCNAISFSLIENFNATLEMVRYDPDINVVVVTGNERAFAAGADIKELQVTVDDRTRKEHMRSWSKIKDFPKPLIAAVNGYALGGGCELAMSCDIIYAGEKAIFGLPEILLGIIPGAGGTQRLIKAIGKSRTMEHILTGRRFNAEQAKSWGLVSNVYPVDQVVNEAVKLAIEIASRSGTSVRLAKQCINKANEVSLSDGLDYERSCFYSLFGAGDESEGLAAFIEKRKPSFTKL